MSEKPKTEDKKFNIKNLIKIPAVLGLTIGFISAFLQALLISAGGPEAYGFCVVCHTRDLVNSISKNLFGTTFPTAPFSAVFPTLTIIGVIIGGLLASKRNKEFRFKKGSIKSYIFYFIGGILVMIFGLMLGACPYRAALRTAYGDMIALIGIVSIFIGVFIGTRIIIIKMKKESV